MMLRRASIVVCLNAAVLASGYVSAPADVSANQTEAPRPRRGIGWDSGIGLRYRLGERWGLGLRVNPNLSDFDSETNRVDERSDETENRVLLDDSETRSLGAALMLFRESTIGRWLGIGPYAEIGYSRTRFEWLNGTDTYYPIDERTSRGLVASSGTSHAWTAAVGIRPTFTVRGRFALESRVGVSLQFVDEESEGLYRNQEQAGDAEYLSESVTTGTGDSWNVTVFGQELGPGATLTFMAYF